MGWPTLEQRREYERNRYRERRGDFFRDKLCVRCGSTENLHLDHIDPNDKATHRIWHWSQERRDVELAKCQVLCQQCHMRKSVEVDWPMLRGYDRTSHGLAGYRRGCKCAVCRAGERDRMRRHRAKAAGHSDIMVK